MGGSEGVCDADGWGRGVMSLFSYSSLFIGSMFGYRKHMMSGYLSFAMLAAIDDYCLNPFIGRYKTVIF